MSKTSLQDNPGSENILSLLLNAYYQIDNELQQLLEQKGWRQFSHAQSMIFLNMAEGRTRATDIARHMGVSKQAVNRTIKELVEIGLLQLKPDSQDKRSKRLSLTTKGALVTQEATESITKLEKNLDRKLGSKQAETLKTLLKALSEN